MPKQSQTATLQLGPERVLGSLKSVVRAILGDRSVIAEPTPDRHGDAPCCDDPPGEDRIGGSNLLSLPIYQPGSDLEETRRKARPLPPDQNPLALTTRVFIELSNVCNYADIHKRCPLHHEKGPLTLPGRIVRDVIDTLGKYDYAGQIGFHCYNEPLMDPRLFTFIARVREQCPEARIALTTNGSLLDQVMADELAEAGVSSIFVSGYFKSEYERISRLSSAIPIEVQMMPLDNRLQMYTGPEKHCKNPCHAPLNEIMVVREGRLSLCCLDWRRDYLFGDLHHQTFEEVLRSGELHGVYERLSQGDRYLELCKRCDWSR